MTKRKSLFATFAFVLVLSLALIFGITLSGGTLTAQAADAPSYVTVNSKQLYDGNYLESNDSASVSKGAITEPSEYVAWYKDGVLTLKGYNGGQISFGGALAVDLTIKLKGENTITASMEGISANNCDNLIINADGEATLNINVSSTESRVFGISAGFGATATNGSVTIKGKAAVNIDCNTTSFRGSYGIYAQNTFSIEGSANLSIKCKFSHENNNTSYCIVSGQNKPVFNTDGVVTLDISDSAYRNYCISANNGIDMRKGTLICKYQPGEKTNNNNSLACSKTISTAPEGCVLREEPYYLGETVIKSGVGHTVTVENGTDYYGKRSNQYVKGEAVTVKSSIDDLPFKGWEGTGITFADATQKETYFEMVDDDVTVKAVYDVFIKQPIFTRTGNTTGSVSLQVAKQPYGGYYPIIFLKESGKKINRTFNKDALSDDYTYNYSEVSSFDFPVGTYRIQVEYGGNYFVSEPFEINYSEKEPDGFNVKITDGTAKVGGSTISSAKKGETVTITASNKDGFVFKAWEVVSGGVALANANSVTTTFEMPENNVVIKATYKQLISFVEATVTEPVDGETIDTTAVSGNNRLYKVNQVKWRDVAAEKDLNGYSKFVKDKQYTVSVKFQVQGISDYAFDKENMVAKINGRSAEIESVYDGFVTIKYTFTATAEPLPKYNLTIENGTLENGNTSGEFEEGEEITVIADAAPDGKVFTEWVVVSGDGYFDNDAIEKTKFEMGDSDVTIKAVYKTIVRSVDLTVKSPVAGAVADNKNDLSYPTDKGYTATLTWYDENWVKLAEGATFELGIKYYAEIEVSVTDDYIFSDTIAYLNGAEKSKSDAFPTSFEVNGSFTAAAKPIVYFDVTVVGGRAEIDEEIVIKAESGKQITIIAEPAEGQTFEKWEVVSGGVTLANANSATTTFTMGNGNVEIRAVYKTVHVHTLVRVDEKPATCTENGTKLHYVCGECGDKFADSAAENEITDESTLIIRMAHRFGEWVEEVSATTETTGTKAHKTCEICHKNFDEHDNEIENLTIAKLPGGGEDNPGGETPGTDDPSGEITPTENKGLSGGAIAGIAVGSVAVVGIGGFAIFWFVIKKKSFAELIAAIKGLFAKK